MEGISKITDEVCLDLQTRTERGLNKYGHTLDDNNHDDMIQHAYEEVLDLAQYLKKEQSIYQKLKKIIKENPNDYILGGKVREIFR